MLSETNDDIMNEEYLEELYSYISKQDETYSQDVSFEDFAQKMSDTEYAEQIYDYIGTTDDTFQDDVSQQDFFSKVGIGSEKKNSDSSFVEDSLDSTSAEFSLDSLLEESTSESTEKTDYWTEAAREGAKTDPRGVRDATAILKHEVEVNPTIEYAELTDEEYRAMEAGMSLEDYREKQLLESAYGSRNLEHSLSQLQVAEDYWVDRYFKYHAGNEDWDKNLPYAKWEHGDGFGGAYTDDKIEANGNMFLSLTALEYVHPHPSQRPPSFVEDANGKLDVMVKAIRQAESKEDVIRLVRQLQGGQINGDKALLAAYDDNIELHNEYYGGTEANVWLLNEFLDEGGNVFDESAVHKKGEYYSTTVKEMLSLGHEPTPDDIIDLRTGEFIEEPTRQTFGELQVISRYNAKRYAEDVEDAEWWDNKLGAFGNFMYDFGTGVMDLGNSFQSLYDRHGAAVDMYDNSFRSQANLKEGWDLTDDEISKGVSENLAEGNLRAARAMFYHQAAQTAPQLIAQAAVAYFTRGLGSSAMMWSSSAFMGLSTFGRTWADTYGKHMDDGTAFTMALGDAAVELFSERVFASDIKALAGKGAFTNMSRQEIKQTLFKKGLLSKEMRDFAKSAGLKFVKQGSEEAVEEIIATVGSGVVHSIANDEPMPNIYELLDSAIVGFGMGAGSTSIKAGIQGRGLLTAGVSAMGFGGLRSDLIKVRNNKQKLAEELRNTTDARRREALQTKLKTLSKLEIQMQTEMEGVYEQYTDEDAQSTLELNQGLSENMRKLRQEKSLSKEERARLRAEAKEQYNSIKAIEAKYEPQIAEMKAQKQANSEFVGGMTTSIEVDENTELPDTPLMRGIKNVANVFRGEGKVFLHKNLDDAEAISGVDKQTLAGSNGFYMAEDGSIHIMANMAQNNTAFHEGFHKILRKVDPKYAKRFIDAAFNGMDRATRAKYVQIYRAAMKQGGEALAIEETFAEMAADIAVGDISMEGAGASVVRAGMESLRKTVGAVLGINLKRNGTFSQFAKYVESVAGDFQSGQMLTETMGRFGESKVKEGTFFQVNTSNTLMGNWLSERFGLTPNVNPDTAKRSVTEKNIDNIIQQHEKLELNEESKAWGNWYRNTLLFGVQQSGFSALDVVNSLLDDSMSSENIDQDTLDGLRVLKNMGILNKMNVIVDDGSLSDHIFQEENTKLYGFWNPYLDNTIVVNQGSEGVKNFNDFASTLLHEAIHGFTSLQLESNPAFRETLDALMADAKSFIENSQDERSESLLGQYGFTDVHEFVAEAFSNLRFQQTIGSIPLDSKTQNLIESKGFTLTGSTLFDAFKAMVANLIKTVYGDFGVVEGTSILDAIVDVTSQNTTKTYIDAANVNQKSANVFFQLSENKLKDDNSQGALQHPVKSKLMAKVKKATIKVAKGKTFAGSFINEDTKFTNLATVVQNFEKENGRPPKILFWMGDQSARGTYTTLDGTKIELEGGISFSQDPANTDKGVVWATNKNNNEVQGLVKDADIVAIVSGKPETGHRFYKGTSRVVYTELMEAFNRNKGKSIEFPARGKKFNIDVPTEGFTDPLQAIKFFYNSLAENGKKPAAIYKESKEDKKEGRGNFMEEIAKHDTLDSYLEESKGDRMSGLDMFLTTSGEMKAFMENLGMKSDFDYQNDMRDGYLVENEFTTGDIYAFYEFERDADGRVVTQDGNHSTYSTDIKGKALGIANRKDNIYQIADLSASTTTEVKLSGKQQLELLVEAGELTQAQVDEINTIEDEKKRNKAKGDIIRSVAGRLRGQGKTYLADRLTAKSGYVSAEKAGDKSLKRIVSDAGTSYDGKTLLESLIVGQTLEGRMNVLQEAATQLTEEGNAKVREFKNKEGNFEMLSLPVGMVLERAAEIEGVSFKDMQESVNPETKRKAGVFFQSTIITSIAQRILLGEKKADIIASLRAKGMSRADANLIYAKASQNARGVKQGWKEGTRERSAQLAAKRKAERKAESSKAKDLRKKLAAVLKTEKKVSRNIINEMIRVIKEAGVEIKPTQVAQLIRTAAKVAKMKGRNAVDPDIRYEVLNSVVDKVVKIVEKQMDAKGLNDYINQLKRVEKAQKDLRNRFKKLKPTSRSPLISYAEQILDITSINPALLSAESLQLLEDTIKDLNISTKSVSVRKGELSNPYVEIEGLGKVDMRRAKVYFNEIFERLKVEEVSLQEKQLVEKAADLAFENGTDWVTEYEGLMRQINEKELKGVQKKLTAIADEMGLDLNDINDFEAALELYAEAKEEQLNKNRQVIIDEAIIPTFLNFRRLYESNPNFAAIFGITEEMEDDVAASIVKSRMDALTPLELKRLEFAMYDFAVNGKALGINALAASAVAKNDGNKALKGLGLQSRETAKKTPLHWVSSRFENTPTFMRRIFKSSEARIAKFMEISGFSSLRNEASLADKIAEDFNQDLIKLAKQFKQTSIASQVRMQIYSVLTQKPEGVNQTQYLAQVIANFELSLSQDPRWSSGGRLRGKGKNQRKEIRETLDSVFYTENGKKKNYNTIVKELESDKNMMKMIDQLRSRFKRQGKAVKRYAEEFLGMNFKEEENYLPIGFRAVGSTNDDITKIQDDMANIQSAFNSYNLSKANRQASSTYERNENAMGSKTRYIDMNFYSSLSRTYRQNEVKTRTAYSVAKVSAMTSESNEQFKKVVRDPQDRRDMRRKIVQFLTDDIAVARSTDQMLGTNLAKFANEMNNLTVLYYFGGVFNQILKQSSAIMNTIIEGGNPLHLLGYVMTATTGKYSEGQRTILAQADIGQRDYIKETVNATVEGNALAEKNSWKRMRRGFFDASTAALRNTDKVAATASWLMYYESYMRKENGFNGKVSDEVWAEWGANIDEGASAYASTMVAKDQNVSTKRDKSDFNRLNSSQVAAVIQMLVMPFANFLLNKKINLALDFRNLGKGETRANAAKSIGGTALEVAAFHAMSQFVIVPIINGLAGSLLGGEGEEEDSWFDREFSLKMFLKGMATDMNPLVLPIGVMESMYTKMLNLVGYTAFSDGEHDFEDRDFWENYKAWERANGLPIFSSVGRGDASWLTWLKSAGVYGDMISEYALSIKNLSTLSEDNPYYVTSFGTTKYLSTEDAKKMMNLETTKLSLLTTGAFTGLFSKESIQVIKRRERQIGERGITNENEAIGRMIINEGEKGTKLLQETVEGMVGDNPTGIEGRVESIIGNKVVKSVEADKLPSNKYINTIRDINKMAQDPRDAAVIAKKVMKSMTTEEAKAFEQDLLKYYALKEGEGALVKMVLILNRD